MSIFKCKMCGGTLEFEQGVSVAVCEYCGTRQTLPKLDDEKRANLYDRANHFRRNNDYDKAAGIYEQILSEDGTDAEAYWSLVLCRYGIEYVEDPASHRRVPTVNRAQFTSVFDDDNYKSALEYADGYQRAIYEEEAKAINEIQKGILAISQREEPFDVFICYKETDANGRRTQDSVLANDLYHQLTQEGFKVFFSRITLEDKLGTAYEPYIFAALNSAKVMVVIGTKPEYFNAVWVKNEWSRYLSLVKQSDGEKMLIPAYRDMDPYDLPEEFSHLQAQDMSKLGFMQDLIRGIKKIARVDAPRQEVSDAAASRSNPAVSPLLERVYLFLEDGKWQDANIYCEKVLDIDPKNAEAYLGKLMAELQVKTRAELKDCAEPFDGRDNYSKVLRFGDEKLEAEIQGYISYINERNENARIEGIYNNAVKAMNSAKDEKAYKAAAEIFQTIPGFKDADVLAEKCLDSAEVCRKDAIYASAKSSMTVEMVTAYETAINYFQTISGWRDSDEQIAICRRGIEKIKHHREVLYKKYKRKKKIEKITLLVLFSCIVLIILLVNYIIPNIKYSKAINLMDSGNVVEAYETLISLDNYKDCKEKAASIYGEYEIEKLKVIDIGDYFFFGAYEQDNKTSNGKENIEWFVLDKEDNKILVISKYALDCQQYNTSYTDVTWESCSLRKWLNDTFLNDAFSTEEQAKIITASVSADENPEYDTNPGNATRDKVFLLSIIEAEKYFDSDKARMCVPTSYAVSRGAWTSDSYTVGGEGTCWWWLRSPGLNQYRAAYVRNDGSVDYGTYVDAVNVAVRPAMWIDLDS